MMKCNFIIKNLSKLKLNLYNVIINMEEPLTNDSLTVIGRIEYVFSRNQSR